MSYSDNPNCCEVLFFKPSGKWYATETVLFREEDYAGTDIHDAFLIALIDTVKDRFIGMQAVCVKPFHEHSHPISLVYSGEAK